MHRVVAIHLFLSATFLAGTFATLAKDHNDKTQVTYFPDLAMQFYNGERIVSEKCLNQSRLLFRDLQNLTFWASEMWDASAKQPSGFLYGSTHQLGNFDECFYPTWNAKFRPYDVTTQYCLAEIYIHINPNRTVQKFKPRYDPYASILDKVWYTGDKSRLRRDLLHWALCVPASCSFTDVEALLNGYLNFTNSMSVAVTAPGHPTLTYEASLDDKSCQIQPDAVIFSSGTIFFFCFMAILITLSTLSTATHYYFRLKNQQTGTEDLDAKVPDYVKVFSLFRQLSKLTYSAADEIKVLHGIRFFSICLIIIDHRFGTTLSGPMSNMQTVEKGYEQFRAIFITRGDILVDTFFVLSGLVFSLNILKIGHKRGTINIPLAIADRYIRLAPVYAFCMFVVATVYENTGSGPQWNRMIGTEVDSCRQTWWIGLLMLGNYIKDDQMCLVHTWYIPCDFHFFLLGLIGFVILKSKKKVAMLVLAIVGVISIVIPAAITFYYRLPSLLLFYNDFLISPRSHDVMSLIYTKSHNRAGAYIVGMFAGCVIYNYHKPGLEKRLSKTVAILGCIAGVFIMFAVVSSSAIYYDTTRMYNSIEAGLYAGIIRPIWGFGLCVVILCCVFGEVPGVANFLSWSPFTMLSKLVYGMYLVHMIFQIREAAMVRQPQFFDGLLIIQRSCGDMVFAAMTSFFIYILIESPSRDLVRFILTRLFRTPKKETSNEELTNSESNRDQTSKMTVLDIRRTVSED